MARAGPKPIEPIAPNLTPLLMNPFTAGFTGNICARTS